jgi:transglutaminase-like putative cysteine protease
VVGAVEFVVRRARPREGWLPVLLLVAIVSCLNAAVLEATWVPEDGIVVPATLLGLLLGTVLAKRPLAPLLAWILLTLYGALISVVVLAGLRPTWAALLGGWETLRPYWLQNGALFLDRVGGWGTAVFSGQSSQETIVFALGLGLASYFLAAFASWQIFRHYRPLAGLVSMGLALALNGYFSGVQIWWLGLFVGLAALLTAVMHYTALADSWDAHQVDYSDEVRNDLFMYAVVIATLVLALAVALPSFSIRRLVRAFQQQPAVQQAEELLERAFAGVESSGQPRQRDSVGGSGILPREFLLGNAPELYETVVMTAVVQSEANLAGVHWRSLSYDVYTGRGWALSEERNEPIAANVPIPLPEVAFTAAVSQTVHWLQDERLARYSLGLPQQFDQDVDTIWRGQTDLVRVNGDGSTYTALSQLSQAAPAMLRETAVTDVPPQVLARYTTLPDELPQRVRELAQEVAGQQNNPYDQARALEQFLRQYPYSLDVERPPRDADPVDYFLFEQQTGYCDFYASAMVVMARAVGLPARMGIGYTTQPTDAAGVQVVYQINSHSWAEVYFAGLGWVEFEPTATFTTSHANPSAATAFDQFEEPAPDTADLTPPPLPEAEAERPFPWTQLFILSLLAGSIWWLWQRGQVPAGQDVVVWSYGRLQKNAAKLGQSPAPSQTPQEFLLAFQAFLQEYGRFPWLIKRIDQMQPHLARLTNLYVRRRYAGDEQSGGITAWQSWQIVKRPLWLLRIVRLFAEGKF